MMTINKYFNRRSLCSLSNVNVHISSIRVSCSAADRHEMEMQRLHKNYMMYTNRNRSGSDKIDFGWGLSSSKSFAFCCASLICRGSCRRKWTFAIEKFQRIDTRRCCEKWQSQSPFVGHLFVFPFLIFFIELPPVDVTLFVYNIANSRSSFRVYSYHIFRLNSHEHPTTWTEGDDETFERPNNCNRQKDRLKRIYQDDVTYLEFHF